MIKSFQFQNTAFLTLANFAVSIISEGYRHDGYISAQVLGFS